VDKLSESKETSIIVSLVCVGGGFGISDTALFRNQSATKATTTRVENRGQISHFFTRVKFRGRVGDMCK